MPSYPPPLGVYASAHGEQRICDTAAEAIEAIYDGFVFLGELPSIPQAPIRVTTDNLAEALEIIGDNGPWLSAAERVQRGYIDAEAYKTGANTDLQAIQAACAAATALGRGAVVRLSPRVWDVGNGLSMSGYTCGLVGTGTSHTSTGPAAPEGTVIHATTQTGPVLNMTGWVYPNAFRGRVEFGKFALQGSNVSDATKVNTGMSNTGSALGSVHIHDISISETGGPCLDFYHLYLADVERVTCVTPVSAKTNDVPYAIFRGSNGNRFVGLGFRSVLSSADVGVGGALVVMDDGGTLPSDGNTFITPWFENLHMPTNGTLIECRANDQSFIDPYFTDCAKEAAATGTSFAHFGVPTAGPDQGGNRWYGRVYGAQAGINDTGIKLSQSRNRIEGVKGYNGANVTLDTGVGYSYVSLGGARSGATGAAFVDNSGQTTNTLLDFVNYPGIGSTSVAAGLATEVNVRRYGVLPTNTAAQNDAALAALFTDYTAAVILAFPDVGTYQFSAPLPNRSNLQITGRGITTILRWISGSMLAPTSTLTGLRFADIALDCTASGTHMINLGSTGGLTHTAFERCDLHPRVDGASFIKMAGGTNLFGITFRDCLMWRNPTATVPFFDATATGSGLNSIRFIGGQMHSQNAAGSPFVRLESTGAASYVSNIHMQDVIGEQNVAGILHGYAVNGVTIQNVIDNDATSYSDDLFKFAAGSGGALSYSVNIDTAGTVASSTFSGGKAHVTITGNALGHRIGRIINGPSNAPILSVVSRGSIVNNYGTDVRNLTTLSAGQTLSYIHHTIISTGSGQTITLPNVTSVPPGRDFDIRNAHATSALTIASAGGSINGSTSIAAGASARFVSDGTSWHRADARAVVRGELVRNVRDYGAVGDGTTDDTAAFQAAIDAVSTNGGKVIAPAVDAGTTYRIDSTVVIKRRVEFEVPAGAIVKRFTAAASTAPVFRLGGNEAALVGQGRVETEKASPDGVVLIGPATLTDSLTNVLSARVRGVVVQGVKATGNVGIKLWSTFVANGGATYQNVVRDVTIDSFGTGVYVSDVANANEFHGCQWKNILDYALDFNANTASRGADENVVVGGFVHASSGVTVVRMQNCIYNQILGLRAEPGGTSVPYNLDATSQENFIQIYHNNAGVGVDSGIRNAIHGRQSFSGGRLAAADGVLTKTKAGTFSDGDFTATAAAGLLGVDTTNHRLYVRESAWRYARVRTRHLALSTVKDFASIPAGTTAELTATVTGAVSGDVVIVTPTGAPEAGLMWDGYVSAADTVTIRLANITTGAIDPASRTWNIEVMSSS